MGFVREQEGLPPLVIDRQDSEVQQVLTEDTNTSIDGKSEQAAERFRIWMNRNSVLKYFNSDKAVKRAMQQDAAEELGEDKVRQILADYQRRR